MKTHLSGVSAYCSTLVASENLLKVHSVHCPGH